MRRTILTKGVARSRPLLISAVSLALGCGVGPSRGESEECDPSLGSDACGAGLFCAAFDGRKVSTCYRNGSRGTGESCSEDHHCASGKCSNGKCRSPESNEAACGANAIGPVQAASEPCDPAYGLDACGANLFCAAFDGRKCATCYPIRSRHVGESCGEDLHCTNSYCLNQLCTRAPKGYPCTTHLECASDTCCTASGMCC
jgi:hypothetical protein